MKQSRNLLLALLVLVIAGTAGCGRTGPATPAPTTDPGVAVLVVDDFGSAVQQGAVVGTEQENCGVATNEVGSGGAGDRPPTPPNTHGELVYQVLKTALGQRLLVKPESSWMDSARYPGHQVEVATDWRYPATGNQVPVRLVAVPVTAYRTADIIQGVRDRIQRLHDGDGGQRFDRFVLNLSFVVIPCDVDTWLARSGTDLLTTYNDLVRDDGGLKSALKDFLQAGKLTTASLTGGDQTVTATAAVLTNPALAPLRSATVGAFYATIQAHPFANDHLNDSFYRDQAWRAFRDHPLGTATDPSGGSVQVVAVGAAGNGAWYSLHGMKTRLHTAFPFAPALWDSVLSVSASDAPGQKAEYSNGGEVMLDGHGPEDPVTSWGTSYAAPRMSALQAWDLLTRRSGCGVIPLKYVRLGDYPNLKLDPAATWLNQGPETWNTLCPGFAGP